MGRRVEDHANLKLLHVLSPERSSIFSRISVSPRSFAFASLWLSPLSAIPTTSTGPGSMFGRPPKGIVHPYRGPPLYTHLNMANLFFRRDTQGDGKNPPSRVHSKPAKGK